MKKIAILLPTIHAGGAEKQACLLAKCLSTNSFDVTFIPYYGLADAEPKNERILASVSAVKVIVPKGGRFGRMFALKRILQDGQFDVLFNYLTFCDVVGGMIAKWSGVKTVFGGIRNARLPWTKMMAERLAHNYISDYTIYNNYSGAEYFGGHGFNPSKNIVIHNCFENISTYYQHPSTDCPKIISVGRFVEQKDYLTALKSIKQLKEQHIRFKYVIVGYGVLEKQIREWVASFGLEDEVDIKIAPKNIPELLLESDIYLSTSLFEGTSNSLLEALNASLPVVATNVGDNSYIVIEGKNGTLHSIGDYKQIADSLQKLITDSSIRKRFGIAGHQNLVDNFSEEKFTNRYVELINSQI